MVAKRFALVLTIIFCCVMVVRQNMKRWTANLKCVGSYEMLGMAMASACVQIQCGVVMWNLIFVVRFQICRFGY